MRRLLFFQTFSPLLFSHRGGGGGRGSWCVCAGRGMHVENLALRVCFWLSRAACVRVGVCGLEKRGGAWRPRWFLLSFSSPRPAPHLTPQNAMGKKSKAARKRAHLAATAALARMQQQQQQQQHQGRPAAGGLPPSKKPKMSAAAAVGSAAPSAGAQRPAPPASRPAMGDLVQAGWVSAHKAGAPFVMWK